MDLLVGRREAVFLFQERARPLTSLEKLVASKFIGYETKLDGATEH